MRVQASKPVQHCLNVLLNRSSPFRQHAHTHISCFCCWQQLCCVWCADRIWLVGVETTPLYHAATAA